MQVDQAGRRVKGYVEHAGDELDRIIPGSFAGIKFLNRVKI